MAVERFRFRERDSPHLESPNKDSISLALIAANCLTTPALPKATSQAADSEVKEKMA